MRNVILLLLLSACTTPTTMMVNEKTNQVQQCGGEVSGSLMGGLVGYYIQSQNAAQCVEDFSEQGFKVKKK